MVAWDARSGERIGGWSESGLPYAIAITRDGARVIIGDLMAPEARILDARTGAPLAVLRGHARVVYNLALSPDDAVVATASYDRTVRQWSASDGSPIGVPIQLDQRPTAVAFDPARPRLAIALEDGTIALYDRQSGAREKSWSGHATWIQALAFSADGSRLVSAGRQDHVAKIWDLRGDAPPVVLVGHSDNLITATFSPDARLVATCSVDDTARIWDAATGELERTIPGPSHTVAFSPDGKQLYTTGRRDFAVVWGLGVDPRDPAALAAEVDATSPWRLESGRLVLRAPL
jgi:WD40 repeat protein